MIPKLSMKFTKIRTMFSPAAFRQRLKQKVLTDAIDIKPRNQEDYYRIGSWLISRRLAFSLVLLAGILSICFLSTMTPDELAKGANYKTYKYNALPLKFMNGEVEILGKSGYRAYLGSVKRGAAEGEGTLYRVDGSTVYEGEFSKNYFEGQGKTYFPNDSLEYTGEFCRNLFEGEGVLYQEDGSKEYEGSFLDGMKDGAGSLYDSSSNPIYEGSFRKDEILYLELLGKTVADVALMYTGRQEIYENEDEYCVNMKDIGSLYNSRNAEDTLSGEWIVNGIYVLQNSFLADGEKLNSIEQLKQYFKKCDYEGNTVLTMADAVSINTACKKQKVLHGPVEIQTSKVFDDVITVEKVDQNYLVYLYRFQKEGVRYTFFAADKNNGFDLYLIEKDE